MGYKLKRKDLDGIASTWLIEKDAVYQKMLDRDIETSTVGYFIEEDADKKQCWVSKDYNCPLKEQCNGLVKPECKEHIDNEEACHAIDKMIEWYYQVEEPEFLKFYNCHLEMIK